VGGIVSAYFSGFLLEHLGTRAVFGITAILPLLVTLISMGIQERRVTVDYSHSWDRARDQVAALWSAVSQKSVYLPLFFLVLWQGSPSSDSAFFYFLTGELGMGPEFLGRVRLGTSIASLAGVWLYQRYLREVPISKVLLWTTLASVPVRVDGQDMLGATN
jgi:MFS family permease